jgi:hypothetical protein
LFRRRGIRSPAENPAQAADQADFPPGAVLRKPPGVPAEHQDVPRDRMVAVEGGGPAQNVVIGVAFDPAVEELVARRKLVEQAGPAPAHAEHH